MEELGTLRIALRHAMYHPQSFQNSKNASPKLGDVLSSGWWWCRFKIELQISFISVFQYDVVCTLVRITPKKPNEIGLSSGGP